MRKTSLAILLAVVSLGAAELDPNTVTVSATRTLNVQPDQAVVIVNLLAAPDSGLDDVLAKLNGTGITAAQLSSVSTQYGPAVPGGTATTNSLWTFMVTVSFSKMKDTVTALSQAASSLGSSQGSRILTFSIGGTQNSPDLLASQPCPMTALISDARRQADAMAAAAGMRTGAIVSVSDGTSLDGVGLGVGSPFPANITPFIGDFVVSGVLTGVPVAPVTPAAVFFSPLVSAPQPACSLTVQFKLMP